MRKQISKAEREALFVASDGKCEITGIDLEPGWHVDHIKPVAAGGVNDISNYQTSTPEANLNKSCGYIELRKWQARLEKQYWEQEKSEFLITALPGSGKTIATLNLAKKHMMENRNAKLIIVVPTVNLKGQWRDDAHDFFGIELQSEEFDGNVKDGFDGFCITYQAVTEKNSYLFRRLCNKHDPLFVIFDEIHHAGDSLSWGESLKYAFEIADKKVSLTGTPFRSDNNQIPFVVYENGVCQPDFTYDYPEAITDKVLRIVEFHSFAGDFEWMDEGGTVEADFNDDMSDRDSKRRLRTALDTRGDWLQSVVVKADAKLEEVRMEQPDAGGLVIAVDQNHARQIVKIFESNGIYPELVISDEPKACESINRFKRSSDKWIVAVKMVSEGIDIKRLRVIVYATVIQTELFFKQAIGRIVRFQDKGDDLAYAFIPADPILKKHADKIVDAQVHAIDLDKEEREYTERETEGGEFESLFTPLSSSESDLDSIILEGERITTDEINRYKAAADRLHISPAKLAAIAKDQAFLDALSEEIKPENKIEMLRPKTKPLEERLHNLRSKCNSKAYRLATLREVGVEEIHKISYRRFGKPQDKLTEDELKEKLNWLLDQINEVR